MLVGVVSSKTKSNNDLVCDDSDQNIRVSFGDE